MDIRRSFLMTLAAVTVVACADTGTPVGPEAVSVLQSQGAGHHVTGSGHLATETGLREFTFHAVESPSGDVSGSYKIVLPNGLFLEVNVECMAVEGNTGWVSGRIRDTNAGAALIGTGSMFYAIDDGEGAGAMDQVSTAAFGLPEAAILEFCAERPMILQLHTVTGGNVQVR